MLYQLIIAGFLLVFLVNLILNLRSLRVPLANSKAPEPAPLVSVLIPARDEGANIASCLESLQRQDYPNFEILVLDDNSSDDTAAIVRRIAFGDNRVRLINGKPLPKGWAGKSFACHQLASEARGDWFLFTDADTTHAPHMLRSVLSLALELKTSLLSGFPRQLANSLLQKIATPVWYFIIMSWMPIWLLQRSRLPKMSMSIGQFLFFPRDEYRRIGGHEAVKSRVLEDIWLGIETNRHGGRHMAVDLSSVVSCNMYRNLGDTWKGLARSIYSVALLSPAALVGLIIAAYLLFLSPFYALWNELFVFPTPSAWRNVIIFQVSVIMAMRWLVDSHFRNPLISTLMHPLGFSFLILDVIYALSCRILGTGVQWKDRLYDRKAGVE
ncbi:MAG: glycosyltransferase [Dehalococcoidales bacterium]|nr:glycosyltransferase [Dehalococcoidales bacterium]